VKLLTPPEISKIKFTWRRLRGGYDHTEVDDFMDQVTETLELLYAKIAELRGLQRKAE
jgi:DivIVA domain-containing protein